MYGALYILFDICELLWFGSRRDIEFRQGVSRDRNRGEILAESDKQSFWMTLPGVLTGIAALLTAATGLLVVMNPHGFGGAKESAAPGSVIETARTTSVEGGGSGPSAASSPQQRKKATVLVTGKDGTETKVFLNSFRDSYSGQAIQLKNGQSIPFDKIRSIDFQEVHEYEQDVRATLTDGRAIEGAIMSGEQITGDTDIGPFSISVKNLRRILLER